MMLVVVVVEHCGLERVKDGRLYGMSLPSGLVVAPPDDRATFTVLLC